MQADVVVRVPVYHCPVAMGVRVDQVDRKQ